MSKEECRGVKSVKTTSLVQNVYNCLDLKGNYYEWFITLGSLNRFFRRLHRWCKILARTPEHSAQSLSSTAHPHHLKEMRRNRFINGGIRVEGHVPNIVLRVLKWGVLHVRYLHINKPVEPMN